MKRTPKNTTYYRVFPQSALNFGEITVDNFAGGGGASMGMEEGLGRPVDIAVNHDIDAIRMHEVNHPGTKHFCESVWDIDPRKVTEARPVGLAWFSPDCKHFSKARGKVPVSKKIRGLAWVAVKWAATVRPRVIIIENVEEFVTWGPLVKDEAGDLYPCPKRKGQTFQSFKNALARYGYTMEHRELRACDYGTPTSRKRFFLIARCDGQPIVWPEPTHGPGRIPYRTAADIIDWSLPCPSIFERKRPLAEATLRRIAEGIRRFVVESAEPFIVTNTTGHPGTSAAKPLRTVTTGGHHALVVPKVAPLITECANASSKGKVWRPDQPLRTICAQVKGGHFALMTPFLAPLTHHGKGRVYSPAVPMATITGANRGEQALITPILVGAGGPAYSGKPSGLDMPLGTLTTENHRDVVTAFLAKHYTGVIGADVRRPVPTITSIDHNSLVVAHVQRDFSSSVGHAADAPLGTITSGGGGKAAVVASHMVKLRGTSKAAPADEPLHTISALGTHHAEVRAFLIKYYSEGGQWQSPAEPMHTIPTKDRIGLVMVKGEPYQIVDIGMRMLSPRELFNAQGFPADYVIEHDGHGKTFTKTAQVARCGNSVCPPLAVALVRANMSEQVREGVAA